MAEPDLNKIHDLLVSIAEKAGWMITTANPTTVDTKKNCKKADSTDIGLVYGR